MRPTTQNAAQPHAQGTAHSNPGADRTRIIPRRPGEHRDPEQRIRVVIADEHHLVRDGVKYTLARSAQPGYEVVAETTDPTQTIRAVARHHPDLLVIDITMQERSGLEAIDQCVRTQPQLAVVVLTMHDNPPFVREALHLGARGYVLKDADPAELLLAFRLALRGASYLAPGLATVLATAVPEPQRAGALGPREREVVRLIALGHTYTEIARKMNFSERTVKKYRLRAVEKLGVSSRAELIQWALNNRLVSVPEAA